MTCDNGTKHTQRLWVVASKSGPVITFKNGLQTSSILSERGELGDALFIANLNSFTIVHDLTLRKVQNFHTATEPIEWGNINIETTPDEVESSGRKVVIASHLVRCFSTNGTPLTLRQNFTSPHNMDAPTNQTGPVARDLLGEEDC